MTEPRSTIRDDVDARIGGILFADVVGFSRLTSDEQVMQFLRGFLGEVARYTRRGNFAPLARNTWGDGLFFIFGSVREAGLFALGLCDMVESIDWSDYGLPTDLNVRVAVHAGPLFHFTDPVIEMESWSGKHVVRAARMEPVTPPGKVYASREFAAIAAAQRVAEFRCEQVGRVLLDKKAGLEPLYVVQPVGNVTT